MAVIFRNRSGPLQRGCITVVFDERDTPGRRSPGGLEVRGGAKRIFGGGVSKTVRVVWRHLHQEGEVTSYPSLLPCNLLFRTSVA